MILHIGLFFYNQVDFINHIFCDIKELLLAPGVLDKIRISVYDDGSNDGTGEQTRQVTNNFSIPVELNLFPDNQGVKTRLIHFVNSTKDDELILFVAGDDGLNVEELLKAWEYIEKYNFDLLICNAWRIRGEQKYQAHSNRWPYSLINTSSSKFYSFLTHFYPRPLLVQATLFKATTLKNVQAFDWNSALDDWPLFLRLFASSSTIRFENDIYISNYIYSPGSVSASQERILHLVEETSLEYSLDFIWGPLSLVQFRRDSLCLRRCVYSINNLSALFRPRFWVGLTMEVYYLCRSTLNR